MIYDVQINNNLNCYFIVLSRYSSTVLNWKINVIIKLTAVNFKFCGKYICHQLEHAIDSYVSQLNMLVLLCALKSVLNNRDSA